MKDSGIKIKLIRRMMSVNSKNKGSSFERVISKTFTEWWNNDGMEGKFFRTPGSGALAYREQEDVIGDLCTPHGFPYTIECKNQEGWKLEDLFTEKIEVNTDKGSVSGWWRQACIEAYRANKYPMLIMKKNYYEPLVMLCNDIYSEECGIYFVPHLCREYNVATEDFDRNYNVIVLRLSDWLDKIHPSDLVNGGC
jgi:hypothetical protein